MATEYVDLDAAHAELEDDATGVKDFDIKVGGMHYTFPKSMNGAAYLKWSRQLVEYLNATGIPMSEWRPELGIPLDLQEAWLEAALSPDVMAEMLDDGVSIDEINATAEYLYMRYIGIPPPDVEGKGTEKDPIRSLQPSS